jgi:2-polyprenyl-3-methyl-5-hydroxy-6-metoxy-1,4-benzoquinol methylase
MHAEGETGMSLKTLSMTYTARLISAKAAIGEGTRILHLGCGDGYLDPYLCSRISWVVGVDINYAELQSASIMNAGENVEYVLMNGFILPFQASSFDELVCIDVLEHAEDDRLLVLEISRVLKKGGGLTITVPNADYPLTFDPINYLLETATGHHLPMGMWGFGHRRLYKVESLCHLLEGVGLNVVTVTRMSYSLVGLVENAYLLNIVQPFSKSSASNLALGTEADSRGIWRKVIALEPPTLLTAVRDLGIRLDKAFFDGSLSSINFLVRAQKV